MEINDYLFVFMTLLVIISVGLNIYLVGRMERSEDSAARLRRMCGNV
jgi:hypothetical protein